MLQCIDQLSLTALGLKGNPPLVYISMAHWGFKNLWRGNGFNFIEDCPPQYEKLHSIKIYYYMTVATSMALGLRGKDSVGSTGATIKVLRQGFQLILPVRNKTT